MFALFSRATPSYRRCCYKLMTSPELQRLLASYTARLERFEIMKRSLQNIDRAGINLQAYLLEGLVRWNQDRSNDMVIVRPNHRVYDSTLLHTANTVGQSVFGIEPLYVFLGDIQHSFYYLNRAHVIHTVTHRHYIALS